MSPTARTKKLLEAEGYSVARVEYWNPFAKRRVDCFGADLLALKAGVPVLAVQATTTAHQAHRVGKCQHWATLWVEAGARFQVWGWHKSIKTRKWTATVQEIT